MFPGRILVSRVTFRHLGLQSIFTSVDAPDNAERRGQGVPVERLYKGRNRFRVFRVSQSHTISKWHNPKPTSSVLWMCDVPLWESWLYEWICLSNRMPRLENHTLATWGELRDGSAVPHQLPPGYKPAGLPASLPSDRFHMQTQSCCRPSKNPSTVQSLSFLKSKREHSTKQASDAKHTRWLGSTRHVLHIACLQPPPRPQLCFLQLQKH